MLSLMKRLALVSRGHNTKCKNCMQTAKHTGLLSHDLWLLFHSLSGLWLSAARISINAYGPSDNSGETKKVDRKH